MRRRERKVGVCKYSYGVVSWWLWGGFTREKSGCRKKYEESKSSIIPPSPLTLSRLWRARQGYGGQVIINHQINSNHHEFVEGLGMLSWAGDMALTVFARSFSTRG